MGRGEEEGRAIRFSIFFFLLPGSQLSYQRRGPSRIRKGPRAPNYTLNGVSIESLDILNMLLFFLNKIEFLCVQTILIFLS